MRQKVRNGVWLSKAPLGYINNPKTRDIDLNPDKAPKVRKLFELYATGNYNLRELAEWCKRLNLKSNSKAIWSGTFSYLKSTKYYKAYFTSAL